MLMYFIVQIAHCSANLPILRSDILRWRMPWCSHVPVVLAREKTSDLKLIIILYNKYLVGVGCCFCWKPGEMLP